MYVCVCLPISVLTPDAVGSKQDEMRSCAVPSGSGRLCARPLECWEAGTPSSFCCLSQSQTSILEGLSCQDLRKFGTLVSAVIIKSWPRRHGQAVDDFDEILKHLLTGPDVTHLCKLYGVSPRCWGTGLWGWRLLGTGSCLMGEGGRVAGGAQGAWAVLCYKEGQYH